MKSTTIGRRAVVVGCRHGRLPRRRASSPIFSNMSWCWSATPYRSDASQRIGIPQGRRSHALLAGGQRALADLFPGFEQDLATAGAVPVETGRDLRFERPGFDPPPTRDLGLVVRAMSRPLIELTVRQRVKQYEISLIRERCRLRISLSRPMAARFRPSVSRTARGGARPSPPICIEASGARQSHSSRPRSRWPRAPKRPDRGRHHLCHRRVRGPRRCAG